MDYHVRNLTLNVIILQGMTAVEPAAEPVAEAAAERPAEAGAGAGTKVLPKQVKTLILT